MINVREKYELLIYVCILLIKYICILLIKFILFVQIY